MRSLEERAILRQAAAIKSAERKASKREHRAKVEPRKVNRGREKDHRHLAFVRRLPCVATWVRFGLLSYGCQAAHVRMPSARHGKPNPGRSVKPDDKWTVPLTPEEHRFQGEVVGERVYWSDLGLEPFDLCLALYAVSGDEQAAIKIITSLPRRSVERRETRG